MFSWATGIEKCADEDFHMPVTICNNIEKCLSQGCYKSWNCLKTIADGCWKTEELKSKYDANCFRNLTKK